MNKLTEVKSRLRQKKAEYKSLRDDYELLRQNIKSNVDAKKIMRREIMILTKDYQDLKNKQIGLIEVEDAQSD